MTRSRLGVVALIPGCAAAEIDGLRRALGDGTHGRISPHITLVPPVNVNASNFPGAMAALRRACSTVGPLRLEIGPPQTFWPDTPVLYLAVHGDLDGLTRLRDAVFVHPFARPLTWPFVPHITLTEDLPGDRLAELAERLGHFRTVVTIERLDLLRQREERRWESIADVALGPRTIIGRGGLEVELRVGERLDPQAHAFFQEAWAAHRTRSYGSVPDAMPFAVAAEREGEVVGVATGDSDDELRLDRLVVGPSATSQGIGSHLLSRVERLGSERGCRRAVLICQSARSGWYADRGWTALGELPDWTHSTTFVRMAKDL